MSDIPHHHDRTDQLECLRHFLSEPADPGSRRDPRRVMRVIGLASGPLVHFTRNADGILRDGFFGTVGMMELAHTTFRSGPDGAPGYNFGFPLGSREAAVEARRRPTDTRDHYGDHALFFDADYLLVHHRHDDQVQAIFWGPSIDPGAILRSDARDNSEMQYWAGRYLLAYPEGRNEEELRQARKNARQPSILWSDPVSGAFLSWSTLASRMERMILDRGASEPGDGPSL